MNKEIQKLNIIRKMLSKRLEENNKKSCFGSCYIRSIVDNKNCIDYNKSESKKRFEQTEECKLCKKISKSIFGKDGGINKYIFNSYISGESIIIKKKIRNNENRNDKNY